MMKQEKEKKQHSHCPLLPKSDFSVLHLGCRKSMWGFEAGIWLPYPNSDPDPEQWTVPIFHHGNVLIRETKCSFSSLYGGYFIHDSIIIYRWQHFICPVQLPNLFFYHLVLNANKSRILSSFGFETESACKLEDSMNFCTFFVKRDRSWGLGSASEICAACHPKEATAFKTRWMFNIQIL